MTMSKRALCGAYSVLRTCMTKSAYIGKTTAQSPLLMSLEASMKLNLARAMCSHTGVRDFQFRQLFDHTSHTYTYILADVETGDGIIIDPVIELVDRDIKVSRDMGVKLKYGVNTHSHADHVTGTGEMRKRLANFRSVIGDASGAEADIKIKEGDSIKFGKFKLDCLSTPGHTPGCMTYVWQDKGMVFCGDAILIRGCGRTDFPGGSAEELYDGVHKKVFTLPDDFILYPGHDYTGQCMTSIKEEKHFNSRLTRDRDGFIEIMKNLNLPYPKQIDRALRLNQVCGLQERLEVVR